MLQHNSRLQICLIKSGMSSKIHRFLFLKKLTSLLTYGYQQLSGLQYINTKPPKKGRKKPPYTAVGVLIDIAEDARVGFGVCVLIQALELVELTIYWDLRNILSYNDISGEIGHRCWIRQLLDLDHFGIGVFSIVLLEYFCQISQFYLQNKFLLRH